MLEQSSSVPRLYYLTKSVATFLALIALLRADAPMIAAGAPRPEIPSAQEIAPLIGGGNVIANASSDAESRDFECTYELARNQDGSRSMNNASLSVTHYGDPAKAQSVFDGYVKSSVESTLDRPSIGSIPILRLEQGSTYTAFSDASVARVIHGTTLVTLAVVNMSRPPNRGAEYLKWSDQIRRLAIHASGATPEPDAKIGPPSGLPKNFADRMAWNFLDDILWPAAHTAPFILGLGIPVLLVGLGIVRRRRRRHLLRHGQMAVGRVIEISQTGITVNQVPMMRLVVDVERAGEQPRRIKIRQLIDLGSMPRAGDRVYVLLDPKNPGKGTLAPSPSGAGIKVRGIPAKGGPSSEVDLNTDIARDVIALSPRLREHGKLGIAKLVSISPTTTTAKQLVLDIDTIGTPPRRVTTTQIIDGTPPLIGERVYILVDPDDPNIVALVPRSMTGGQSLPATANRLDPLVLGPEILRKGARAAGIVTSALEQPMANPALAAKGCSKWQLVIDVTPDDGSPPYQSTLVTAFSNREKAERIARVGAQVPLRYDPADRQTFAIDSIAMGYGDPYEAVRNLFRPG